MGRLPPCIGLLLILPGILENLPLLPPTLPALKGLCPFLPDIGPILGPLLPMLPLPNGFDPALPGICWNGPAPPPPLLWANEGPKLPCLYDGDCFARCVNCISGTAFGAPYSFSAAGA